MPGSGRPTLYRPGNHPALATVTLHPPRAMTGKCLAVGSGMLTAVAMSAVISIAPFTLRPGIPGAGLPPLYLETAA